MSRLMSPHSLLAAVKVLRNGGFAAVKNLKSLQSTALQTVMLFNLLHRFYGHKQSVLFHDQPHTNTPKNLLYLYKVDFNIYNYLCMDLPTSAVIPKGSRYYVNDDASVYISNALRFDGIVGEHTENQSKQLVS